MMVSKWVGMTEAMKVEKRVAGMVEMMVGEKVKTMDDLRVA